MNIQTIIVFCIVIAAAAYVGNIFWQKARASAKKGDCGSDCGCGKK